MKKSICSLGWLTALIPFLCIGIAHAAIISKSSDETRSVANFSSIQNSGSFHVFVTIGQSESLKLEGNPETLKNVETVVEGGTLKIRMKKNFNFFSFNNERINVYVQAKHIDGLNVSGSGKIEVSNTINGNQLATKVSGSGSIVATANVTNFSANVSGSGKISVEGKTRDNSINISGSGKFSGSKLHAEDTHVKISGSGSADVVSNQTLNANISGSGRVNYTGTVKNVNAKTSGSGKVRRV